MGEFDPGLKFIFLSLEFFDAYDFALKIHRFIVDFDNDDHVAHFKFGPGLEQNSGPSSGEIKKREFFRRAYFFPPPVGPFTLLPCVWS